MGEPPAGIGGSVSRRDLLATGAGAGVGLASGCLQRVRSLAARPAPEQVSLTIKTLPADADEPATLIARYLLEHLRAVGIDAAISLLPEAELRRDVLTRGAFDLYVDRMPIEPDPDFLRPRLGSVFTGEPGWQNPFALTNLTVDDLLAAQRRSVGIARRDAVADLQGTVARLQPFVSVAVPTDIGAVRTDRFHNWDAASLGSPVRFLGLEAREDGPLDRLRLAVTDARVTENLNPIAVEFRDRGTYTGLLYDSLGAYVAGEVRPWLAEEWTWDDADGATVTVSLRDDPTWHDGTALTADDVAFTYRFLHDTSLGERETAVPAPRFRGRTSLVETVAAEDDATVRLGFGDTARPAATRSLTVPILPEHVWRSKASEAELAGVGVNRFVTEALVWPNAEPVGSGPLAFQRRVAEEALILERFDDHFLHRDDATPPAEVVAGGADFRELSARVAPSDVSAVELAAAGEVDATVASTDPTVVPRIGREPSLSLLVEPAPVLYHVGFNTRRDPLSNPHVRRAIARVIDKAFVVDDVFDGYASPTATPLVGTEWTAPPLEWTGIDPEVPFVGADGRLDEPTARNLFREAGFRYDEDGRLLAE